MIDPTTIEFKLVKPFVAFLQVLPWQWVVNPKEVEAHKGSDDGQAWLGANIAGSGAFVLKRSEPGNLYEVERAPDAWRKGGGNVTNVIWQIVRETVKQRNMIQAGQVHMAMDLTVGRHGRAEGQARGRSGHRAGIPDLLDQDEHRERAVEGRQLAPRGVLRVRLQGDARTSPATPS